MTDWNRVINWTEITAQSINLISIQLKLIKTLYLYLDQLKNILGYIINSTTVSPFYNLCNGLIGKKENSNSVFTSLEYLYKPY